MTPIDPHDLQIAHDLGTVEGKLAAIYDNTKVLPELIAKVERHDAQLKFLRWAGATLVGALIALAVAWFEHQVK